MDRIDTIIAQWKKEHPKLDTQSMELIGRMQRVMQHLSVGMTKTFSQYDINGASFDILATLRRSGKPYALSPRELMKTKMMTSGTMTSRLGQLEETKLVKKIKNPLDGSSFLIQLTSEGKSLFDKVFISHVTTQNSLLSNLSKDERQQLNSLLHRFLETFEGKT